MNVYNVYYMSSITINKKGLNKGEAMNDFKTTKTFLMLLKTGKSS